MSRTLRNFKGNHHRDGASELTTFDYDTYSKMNHRRMVTKSKISKQQLNLEIKEYYEGI